ncbi:MAG: cation diffusion facilitator family transporter [bacterium]
MAQLHPHDHLSAIDLRRAGNRRRMRTALAINVGLLVVGVAGGIAFDSLAVFADAGHVLSDVGAIALGLGAATRAARRAGSRRTFGYHRGEVLAALVNGVALVALAVVIVVAAIGRLSDPPGIDSLGVLAVGIIGLSGNAWATLVLARGERSDINLEAVLRHSAADALGSLAVIAAALAVLAFDWRIADPIASIAIAGLILASSVRLVREPLDVLMESAPASVDVDELGAALCRVKGVSEVHELHVWTVTSGFEALAAHVVTAPGVDRDRARRELEFLLRDEFGIEHTTLQMEDAGDEDVLLQVELQDP